MKSEKKTVEYEGAPSGAVYFYNYKEPLMRFEDVYGEPGYGFQGALIFDCEEDKIQCHFCGEWFDTLQHHIRREHNMDAAAYKKAVGLNKTTALISEGHRAKLIAANHGKRLKNLRNHKGSKRSMATREKIRQTLKENRAEQQNLRNTCPEQLIDRLLNLHAKLGRTPTTDECPFIETLKKVYGSYSNACAMAGIIPRKPGQTIPKWTKDRIVKEVHEFITRNGKAPNTVDMPKVLAAAKRNGWTKDVFREAFAMGGKYIPEKRAFRYTKEELLDFLRTFEKTNGRKPSYSDARRKLIPHLSRYSYNFGSWQNALKLAGV